MQVALGHLELPRERVVVVANGPNPPRQSELPNATVVQFEDHQDLNLPDWWNRGLDWVSESAAGQAYEVFVFNADTWASRSTVECLATALREYDLSVVGPDQAGVVPSGEVFINRTLQPLTDLSYRLPGFAPLLRGEEEFRYDRQFRWWYQDDDLEWQCRASRGTGLVGGTKVVHPLGGNPLNTLQQQYAEEDGPKFVLKWGRSPH